MKKINIYKLSEYNFRNTKGFSTDDIEEIRELVSDFSDNKEYKEIVKKAGITGLLNILKDNGFELVKENEIESK